MAMLLTDYLDRARERSGILSDNRLAMLLGVAHTSLLGWRRSLSVPTPAKMVRLAELAGVSPEVALLHRAAWQADDQASRDVMSRIIATWMEEIPANPLAEPQSLGACASPLSARTSRLRYIMERIAFCISLLIQSVDVSKSVCPTQRLV